ncbi:hypothetical protein R1sor_015304 [Riccia sorocarpa]|uniref:non-specific serine/threonine protein kinase n=1 Tax=Riccia sorocarpa TaxID=122646 RepID=A0ABD3HBV4_9MARC
MASSSSATPDKFTNLVMLLPTGMFMAFSVVIPIITNDGKCHTVEKVVSGIVVGLFAIFCAFSSFTDSFVTSDGTIWYGIVTSKGLWNPFLSGKSDIPGVKGMFYVGEGDKYKLKLTDFFIATLSVISFSSLTLLCTSLTDCFYGGVPSSVLKGVPIPVNFLVGLLFAFGKPARHGIGNAIRLTASKSVDTIILWSLSVTAAVQGLSPDGKTLLDVKSSLIDRAGILSSWDASDESPCGWYGVACLADGLSVNSLNLSYNNLSGTISPSIGKLSQLEHLDVAYNNFSGTFPKELGNCSELSYVDFNKNTLVSGTIPREFGQLSKLIFLRLSGLQLTGDIPKELGKLTNLSYIFLDNNILSGRIPSSLGDITRLIDLWLWNNNLSGQLPASLGSCKNLSSMMLNANRLEGSIPVSFGQLKNLVVLNLTSNALTGQIPSELGNCTQLTHLYLGHNGLTGNIPQELGRLSALSLLHVQNNSLTGQIPSELGNCTKLNSLYLGYNELTGSIPEELGILSVLSTLQLYMNSLTGQIPSELDNCTQLNYLYLGSNSLTGSIPIELGRLSTLFDLALYNNTLTGQIPFELGNCTQLTNLVLANNQLMGNIPSEIGRLRGLEKLLLNRNMLTGPLPPDLGLHSNLSVVQIQWIHSIKYQPAFSSTTSGPEQEPAEWDRASPNWGTPTAFPARFDGQQANRRSSSCIAQYLQFELSELDDNQLTGLPDSWASLVNLKELHLAGNMFTGPISPDIGHVSSLQMILDLSRNYFTGSVPNQFSNLHLLQALNLSHNNLSGEIPASLDTLVSLTFVDISFNNLVGVLPSSWAGVITVESIMSNPKLCFPGENCVSQTEEGANSKGFSTGSLIGITASGCPVITISVIYFVHLLSQRQRRKAPQPLHLIGFCTWKNLKFLVFKFVNNGSLYHVLHEANGLPNWDSRYRVALGTALGLEYLHYDCVPAIVHRDIKSANILLDDDLEPQIIDFGTAKFQDVSKSSPSTFALVGTYGYIAPEYGLSLQVNKKTDAYAFGVVLLELLTGKYVVDPEFHEGTKLVTWVETNIKCEQDLLNKVLDSRLLEVNESYIVQEMILVMKVAMFCVKTLPSERPTMTEVVTMLKQATDSRLSQQRNIVEISDLLMAA